jgi:hypothetical protein
MAGRRESERGRRRRVPAAVPPAGDASAAPLSSPAQPTRSPACLDQRLAPGQLAPTWDRLGTGSIPRRDQLTTMRPTRTAARRRGAGCCEPCLPGRTCHNLLLWTAVRGALDDTRPPERGMIGRVGCRSSALRKLVREQRGRRRGSRCLCRAEPATAMPVGASPSCCGRRGDRLGRAAHIAIIAPLVSVSTTEVNKAMMTVSKRRVERHEQGLPSRPRRRTLLGGLPPSGLRRRGQLGGEVQEGRRRPPSFPPYPPILKAISLPIPQARPACRVSHARSSQSRALTV